MSVHRFFAPPSSVEFNQIRLDSDESHHLRRVLRLRPGATVRVFDGQGSEYLCRLERFDQQHAHLSVVEQIHPDVESPLSLTLAQALAKGEKFDFIVQKATELGAHRLIPLITAHTLSAGLRAVSQQRQQRWRKIVLEATKQCGRSRLMEVVEPLLLKEMVRDAPLPMLLFSEHGGQRLADLRSQWREAPPRCILIGPEGGWQPEEIDAVRAAGALEVSLGPRILRTETAAVVAIGLVQHLFGDLG